MDSWWPSATRPASAIALVGAAALTYGTVVHIVQLAAGGWDAYQSMPNWLAIYFLSLTLLDPLAAVLLFRRRQIGLILGCAILLSDSAANGYANYSLDSSAGITTGRVGHAILTALTLTFTGAAIQLWLAARNPPRAPEDRSAA